MVRRGPIAVSLAAVLGTLTLAPADAQTTAPFTPEQREAIGAIVRDYLLKNPEVLQEAIAELERRTQEAQRTAQTNAIRSERERLLHSPHDYVVGNPQGDVTLVEFLDYNCPYCKKAVADIAELIKSDPKLRVVLKDFPVLGPDSVEASRVALAARLQLTGERLLEFHTRLMEVRGRVNGERARAIAKEMGLDMGRLDKDANGPVVRAALQETATLGDRLGLTGTPAFIVGEEIIPGAVGADPLRQAVSNLRSCGKATC